jgi:ABC-type Mn2+/Zn2+ transport system ATPase subunit
MSAPVNGDILVRAEHAEIAYGNTAPVLSDISLALPAGELVILLGPNGGGKTTLFRALTGEVAARSGLIGSTAAVSYLPQHDRSRVDFPVSALDVVLMGTLAERRVWSRPSRAQRDRALAALEQVGLREQWDRTYGELSGGQRRRVLLARTIVGGAPVVLLDEPLAGVDPQSASAIATTLSELADDGRLVIEASHDIERARSADRVICLAGRVLADGPPAVVLTADVLRETYADELGWIGA